MPSTARFSHPPETLEGWYALHQFFTIDRPEMREVLAVSGDESGAVARGLEEALRPDGDGWSAVVPLVGSRADLLILHLRPTLDEIASAQRALARLPLSDALRPVHSFLSVAEAGMYHLTAKLATEAQERGGEVGDERYRALLEERLAAEQASDHVQRRLRPALPGDLPWVCFYPMSKRRDPGANWYAQPLEERSRMMWEHGMSGRRYAGRVLQIVTGAIGLDAWEWGVTLFARDPLEFKKIVSELRYDEASAVYGEFGEFFVGKVSTAAEWIAGL